MNTPPKQTYTPIGHEETSWWRVQGGRGDEWADCTTWDDDWDEVRKALSWFRANALPGLTYRMVCRHESVTVTVENE